LGLIRLEFGVEDDRIGVMQERLAGRPAENKPKLLDQVRNVIRVKHYSSRTEQAYIDWIKRFILFHGKRHPAEMAEEEVAQFVTHLARDMNVAASTQNQHVKASLTCQEQI
jgi:Phage integrase, N-terminal SAM-like domain